MVEFPSRATSCEVSRAVPLKLTVPFMSLMGLICSEGLMENPLKEMATPQRRSAGLPLGLSARAVAWIFPAGWYLLTPWSKGVNSLTWNWFDFISSARWFFSAKLYAALMESDMGARLYWSEASRASCWLIDPLKERRFGRPAGLLTRS